MTEQRYNGQVILIAKKFEHFKRTKLIMNVKDIVDLHKCGTINSCNCFKVLAKTEKYPKFDPDFDGERHCRFG